VWIYQTNNDGDTNGSCLSKNNQTLNCGDINRSNQCESGGGIARLSGQCTWIYNTNSEVNTNGNCIATSNDTITCEDLNRTSQCALGGEISALFGKCGLYNNVCKTLCSEINENTCKNTRSNDCFWIDKNGTQYSGGCVNKV
jgi:hypothetical protein